ncbi:MAG TPA: CDP-alcohol phosphatidyltransferase family protein [Nitrospirota bacterium]
MNLPNILTVLRIVLTPVFLVLLLEGYRGAAVSVFVAAALTDALDGAIARFTKKKPDIGVFLDPIADKFLVLTAFIALTYLGRIPLWLTFAALLRDCIILTGSVMLYRQGYKSHVRPAFIGKATTFVLFVLLVFALASYYLDRELVAIKYLSWTAAGLIMVSGVQYLWRGLKFSGRP